MNSQATKSANVPQTLTREFIPDCDFLFSESVDKKGRKKSKFLGKIFSINKWALLLNAILYVIQSSPLWIIPLISANIINLATAQVALGVAPTIEFWNKLLINVLILGLSILQNAPVTTLRLRFMDRMLRRTSAGIKCSVVKKLQSLAITYHKDMKTGKIQSKFLKDTDTIEVFLRQICGSLMANVISVIIAIVVSVVKNGTISLFFLLIIPCNVGLTFMFRKKIRRQAKDYRVKTENMSARLTTMLEMMQVTKSHGLEQTEINSVEGYINTTANSGLSMDRTIAWFGSLMFVVTNFLSGVCLVFCVVLAVNGKIGIGDIVLYQSMFSQISGHVSAIIGLAPQLSTGMDGVHSVSEIMNATDVEVNIGKRVVPDIHGDIIFENVSYHYPQTQTDVVKDFSLEVKQGECIAVVGSSGSGKSTLMNLIVGFLKPTEGKLKIDGNDINDLNLSEYRHHISVVPQSSILFAGTVEENITYGLKKYSKEDLERVLEMANVNEFIKDLPDGVKTNVGEHGDKLSGGQKQRITSARALIRNPKIIILDEATSALDNISEDHVQKAIETAIKGRTTFIVAHRLSTIRGADRIVVMEEGKCVEMGTYEQLMAKKGKFFKLKELNELNLKKANEELS